MIGDTFHALKYGPVPSFICKSLQMLEGRLEMEADFVKFCKGIRVDNGFKAVSTEQSDLDELSRSDMKCLDKSIEKYRDILSFVWSFT